MKTFPMIARRSFRMPDGTIVERGAKFTATVRSRSKDQIEYFILSVPDQMEEFVVPCQHVCFDESVEVENGQGG